MTTSRTTLRSATEAERKALGIPPAYTDVQVAVDPKSDLLATAKTAAGKTFYKYSQKFIDRQASKKWDRVKKLGAAAEKIEARIRRDAQSGPRRDVAMTAHLIMLTGIRNGNAPQGKGESFGATSLLMEHVTHCVRNEVTLDFVGKKGVQQHYVISDTLLAGYVRERRAAGVTKLFPHTAPATLRYLKSVGAKKVHDLRTWRANELASRLVNELLQGGMPTTAKAVKQLKKSVAKQVGEALGNSAGMAMKSYIDPRVWKAVE